MSIVTLVSGGLDSTLMAAMAREERIEQFPLFINYGQRACARELEACTRNLNALGLSSPTIADLSGYGALIRSGLTDETKRIFDEAFTPGRNLMFLLIGAAFAYQRAASSVAIGLLNEATSIFPDQTSHFIQGAEKMLSEVLGRPLRVLAPLMEFSKSEIIEMAKKRGITSTYSCHAGTPTPCGVCVACREFLGAEG